MNIKKLWMSVFALLLSSTVIFAQEQGIKEEGKIEIIDLKAAPDKISSIVDNINYLPGYHMNKKHWLTIKLDGLVPIKTIYSLIDESFNIIKKKR